MAYDHVWDDTTPPDTQAANLLGQDIRYLKDDIAQRMPNSGLDAAKPPLENAFAGYLYFATDTGNVYQLQASSATATDPGTWVLVPLNSKYAATVDLTAQTANIGSTAMYTSPTKQMFLVAAYIVNMQAATTSSTLPSVQILWTDADSSVSQAVNTPTDASNVLGVVESENVVVVAKATTSINYAVTGYASVGATPLQFGLHIRVTPLG